MTTVDLCRHGCQPTLTRLRRLRKLPVLLIQIGLVTVGLLTVSGSATNAVAASQKPATKTTTVAPKAPASPSLAVVAGRAITVADVEFFALSRGLKTPAAGESQKALLEQLIDRELIRRFLQSQKVAVDPQAVLQAERLLEDQARRRGEDPVPFFARLGLTSDRLKEELSLPLLWEAYVVRTVTAEQLQREFAAHRGELDGTRIRVRQIFRKATTDDERMAAERLLNELRPGLMADPQSFGMVAKQQSQAPSAEHGGDVGWLSGRGRLPDELTTAAHRLPLLEISEPIRTAFGVHLVQVTDREPGTLSLEDARPVILERLSREMWSTVVTNERRSTKLEYLP